MTSRENTLRAIRFEHPEYIPINFHINDSVFYSYEPDAVEELLESHPIIAGKHRIRYDLIEKRKQKEELLKQAASGHAVVENHRFFDEFGVEWEEAIDGIRGVVQNHPLADFSKIREYRMPALPVFNLEGDREWVKNAKAAGNLTCAGLPHGHMFLRLTDLCGYENVLMGMMDGDDDLKLLIRKIEEHSMAHVEHWSKVGFDMISFPEDLGMQVGPMISPGLFREYIKPSYTRMMKPARESGAIIHMHSDGDIRTLADDLIDGGVDILNLQDLVNGIDWIRDRFAGRTCVELDIDRQKVTVFGTPSEVDALIREEVEKLSSPAGGLMMIFGWYAGTPLENIRALMDAMEKYMFYWS